MGTTPTWVSLGSNISGHVVWIVLGGDSDLQEVNEAISSRGFLDRNMGAIQLSSLCRAGDNVLKKHTDNGSWDGARYFIRVLHEVDGFVLVREMSNKESLNYKVALTVLINCYNESISSHIHFDDDVARALDVGIRPAYLQAVDSIESEAFGEWFAYIMKKHGDAIEIGDGSGVYFIPNSSGETWRDIVGAIEDVTPHEIFSIAVKSSRDVVKCVIEGLSVASCGSKGINEGDIAKIVDECLSV